MHISLVYTKLPVLLYVFDFSVQHNDLCVQHNDLCVQHSDLCVQHSDLCVQHNDLWKCLQIIILSLYFI